MEQATPVISIPIHVESVKVPAEKKRAVFYQLVAQADDVYRRPVETFTSYKVAFETMTNCWADDVATALDDSLLRDPDDDPLIDTTTFDRHIEELNKICDGLDEDGTERDVDRLAGGTLLMQEKSQDVVYELTSNRARYRKPSTIEDEEDKYCLWQITALEVVIP